MNNPYEKIGNFEQGFEFVSEGKKYLVETGKTETHEGDKYRICIREEGSKFPALPINESEGLNAEELKDMVDFLIEITNKNLTIKEISKQYMDHAIDKHAEDQKGK